MVVPRTTARLGFRAYVRDSFREALGKVATDQAEAGAAAAAAAEAEAAATAVGTTIFLDGSVQVHG